MILQGWGRYPRIEAHTVTFESVHQLRQMLQSPRDYIVYGLGRSYGDSALNPNAVLSNRYNKILQFDDRQGRLTCESGVTLSDLLEVIIPRGWFLGVTPGTKFITVGGAIASDVHGKNHHQAGCFSDWLESFCLLQPDGQILKCTPHDHRDLFLATCGGMGLTGIILKATFKLQPIQSVYIRQRLIAARHLEEIVTLFKKHHNSPYSVAWIDCLAGGKSSGRSILLLGEHAPDGGLKRPKKRQVTLPFAIPGICLNKYSVSWFNRLYFAGKSRSTNLPAATLDEFFYPLDAIGHWNRLYGAGGFMQYQFVLPKEAGITGLRTLLRRINTAGSGSFLAVLKWLGPENANHLSFPLEGFTLALDFKYHPRVFELFEELDRIVVDYGGRLYISKDARMPRNVFRKGYPRWRKFVELRKARGLATKFNSLQSRRLEI